MTNKVFRLTISGLLLIANLFLLATYNSASDDHTMNHPFYDFKYGMDMYLFLTYQYVSPFVYLVVFGFIKPEYNTIKYLNIPYYFLIFEVVKYVDFALFYNWTIINVDIVCPFLIAIVIIHLSLYVRKSSR